MYPQSDARSTVPGTRDAVPGTRDAVPGSRPDGTQATQPRFDPYTGKPLDTPAMQDIDPGRTPQDDLAALRDRIAQLEKEAEARDAAAKRAEELDAAGISPGGEPVEHFHRLADGTVVRGFGTATLIADGDKPPMPVVESYVVPVDYDKHYNNVQRSN